MDQRAWGGTGDQGLENGQGVAGHLDLALDVHFAEGRLLQLFKQQSGFTRKNRNVLFSFLEQVLGIVVHDELCRLGI